MKTFSKFVSVALCALTLLAGCIPSLSPVYKEDQLVLDDAAIGTWAEPNSKARWVFNKRDDRSYTLVYTDEDGRQGRFVARLANIEGSQFLDLFPDQSNGNVSGFYNLHLVPIHTIYLVRHTKPDLELAAIDFRWFQKYLTDHPKAIQNATFGEGGKLLTAPTPDVQAFVLAHKDAFTSEFNLQRQGKSAE
jgi:hypothetical protein